jgi:hypothetical protein
MDLQKKDGVELKTNQCIKTLKYPSTLANSY